MLKTKLGLEPFYQYVQQPVGAGMTQWTNVANGNSLLTLDADAGFGPLLRRIARPAGFAVN